MDLTEVKCGQEKISCLSRRGSSEILYNEIIQYQGSFQWIFGYSSYIKRKEIVDCLISLLHQEIWVFAWKLNL